MSANQEMKDQLTCSKFLGIGSFFSPGQCIRGKSGSKKSGKHVSLITRKAGSAREMCIGHNYIVHQVTTFSPLDLNFDLRQFEKLDKNHLLMYKSCFKLVQCNTKHYIFMLMSLLGHRVRSFKGKMVKGIIRETELQIHDEKEDIVHAMNTSLEAVM